MTHFWLSITFNAYGKYHYANNLIEYNLSHNDILDVFLGYFRRLGKDATTFLRRLLPPIIKKIKT